MFFFNKKIVITGRFKHFSRIDLEQRIINLGAVVSKSISKNTDFLLVGDKPGNNLFKALKLKKRSSKRETII
ncbi:hypothetical protein HIC20_02930 [Buchnera aphidicola (Hormaphis cornu)]|nr:hypothetical protein HIC20_02930 [Buchnera aphidicola (Hormaphis cornu)]